MEYIGKLYGKIGKKYFDTGKTSEDWDLLEKDKNTYFAKQLDVAMAKIKELDSKLSVAKELQEENDALRNSLKSNNKNIANELEQYGELALKLHRVESKLSKQTELMDRMAKALKSCKEDLLEMDNSDYETDNLIREAISLLTEYKNIKENEKQEN